MLALDPDIAELMVAQLLQVHLIGVRSPRALDCPRKNQQEIAGPADRRLGGRMDVKAIGPA
jgi:hypothetical protein